MADLIDVELFPSMRCPALTLTANLKTEQALDVTSNPVVVRLDDSGPSGFIDERDEMLAADCVHEFVIHGFVHTAKREAFDKAQNRALFYGRVVGFVLRLLGLGTATGFGAVTGVTSAVIASHSSVVRSRAINCSGTEINAISFV